MRPSVLLLLAACLGLTACLPPPPTATPTPAFGPIWGASFVRGRYAYVGHASALTVMDLADPAAPQPVAQVEEDGRFFGWTTATDDYLYTVTASLDGQNALLIYSLRDPARPALVVRYPVEYAFGTPAVVADGLAYLNAAAGLLILDITDPAHPAPRGHLAVRLGPRLFKAGERLYSAYGYCASRSPCLAGFVAVDVHDPAQPKVLAEFDPPQRFYGFTLEYLAPNGRAYLGAGAIRTDPANPGVDYGLQVFDVRAPASPALQHTYLIDGLVRSASAERVLYSRLETSQVIGARINPAGDLTPLAAIDLPPSDYIADAALDGQWGYLITARSVYDDQGYRQESGLVTLALP